MKYHNLSLEAVLRRIPHDNESEATMMQASIALLRRQGNDTEDLILAHFGVHPPGDSAPQVLSYDEVRLIRFSLTLGELRNRIATAASSKSLVLADGVIVEIDGLGSVELRPSDAPETNIGPRYSIEFPVKQRGHLSSAGPLVHFGQPSFPTVEQAVCAWIPLRPFHGHSDGRIGRIIMEIPLAGPRLGRIDRAGERTVCVFCEAANKQDEAELTGAWQSADGSAIVPITHPVQSATPIELKMPVWADRITLWLATADSEVRDYFSEDPYNCSRRQRVLYPGETPKGETEDSVLSAINGGEGEQTEFKPFIRLDSPKAEELIKTAIAFANKRGGTIFLGVNDHQEIDGVEKELRESFAKEMRGSVTNCAKTYCAAVRKKIRDRVNAMVFECEPLHVGGKLLIRIAVQESKSKPCCDVTTKEIWTRRGANTVRPDPASGELKQLLGVASEHRRPF